MKRATLIAKPLLARAESAEILGSLRHNVAVELEDYSSRWAYAGQSVRPYSFELDEQSWKQVYTIVHRKVKIDL